MSESRHLLISLVDEVTRLNGRLKSLFADSRRAAGLNDSEMMVLNAVVEAVRPPTVPQIGRSFGQPRQIVQRAANSLVDAGLVETMPNPDHKRALLLRPSSAGLELKRAVDARADAIAADLAVGLDEPQAAAAVMALRALRKQLETSLRGSVGTGLSGEFEE